MQGISVLTNPQGKPKTLTIDVEQHDNQLDPFVRGLLDLLQQQKTEPTTSPDYEYAASFEEERREFLYASGILANRAYGDDEPEYTVKDLKWINPNFSPNAVRATFEVR